MTTVTLAHLSDVHLAPLRGFTPGYWNVKRGLGFLNWHRRRYKIHQRAIADLIAADLIQQRVDHIAVTGDLTNLGLPQEFIEARKWLEHVGAPDRVSVVPGNHDIYTKRMSGASCLEDWAPYMTSDDWGRNQFGAQSEVFPYVRKLGQVALVGVNSAVPTPPFYAYGRVGSQQLERLAAVLDLLRRGGLMRVVMIHHPPLPGQAPRMKALSDASELKTVLEQHGAELVLHGHNHMETVVSMPCSGGTCVISGVPSASAAIAAHEREPVARYHIYTLNGTEKIERISRGLDSNGSIVEL